MRVNTVVAGGNGAYVVHNQLAQHLPYYRLKGIPPLMASLPCLQRIYRSDCDIIHAIPDAGVAMAQRDASVLLTFHNYYLDIENLPFASYKQKMFYRWILKSTVNASLTRASKIVAVSKFTAALVKDHLKVKNIDVILNGVDEKQFCPGARVLFADDEACDFRLLFSGNLTKRKGIDFVLKFADSLCPGTKICCTAGLRAHDLPPLHPKIQLVDSRPHEEMPDLYRSVDALFFPSNREGLSLVVLEAMASGLPVITTNASSMPELIVHGKGGFLFDIGDFAKASEYVQRLARDPELREAMGAYNRERVLNDFKLSRMISDYDTVFRAMM